MNIIQFYSILFNRVLNGASMHDDEVHHEAAERHGFNEEQPYHTYRIDPGLLAVALTEGAHKRSHARTVGK